MLDAYIGFTGKLCTAIVLSLLLVLLGIIAWRVAGILAWAVVHTWFAMLSWTRRRKAGEP